MPIQRAKPRLVDLDQTPLTSVTASNLPAGTVIQTVTGGNPGANNSSVAVTGIGGVYGATGFYVDITPTSTSNIILVTGRALGGTNYSDNGSYMELFRAIGSGSAANTNSTEAWLGTDYHNNYACMQVPILFYDSTHNTTSTIRYELYLKSHSSYTSYMNRGQVYPTEGRSHLIAQEIKA